MSKYLTVLTAAQMYGKSEITIRRWILKGKLLAKKDPGGRCWLIIVKNDVSQAITSVHGDVDLNKKPL